MVQKSGDRSPVEVGRFSLSHELLGFVVYPIYPIFFTRFWDTYQTVVWVWDFWLPSNSYHPSIPTTRKTPTDDEPKEILDVKEQVPRFQEELRCPVQLQWIEAGLGVEGFL